MSSLMPTHGGRVVRHIVAGLIILLATAPGQAEDSSEDAALQIRGQSPFGYYPQSLRADAGPVMPFRTADTSWISMPQQQTPPIRTFAASSPRIAQGGPADPYGQPMMQPMYPGGAPMTGDPGMAGMFMDQPAVWQPYVAAQGLFGNQDTMGIGQLMMPLYQDGQSLLFADIRGRWDDQSNSEGNFGLALRKMIDPTWFIGGYGFYDYRHTSYGNNFNQGTLGIEAMSVRYEARANGYIPESGAKHADSLSTTQMTGTNIFVNGGFERAYYGADAEVGALLWEEWAGNLELRGFVGGYWFDTGGNSFPSIAGPKGRLEVRMYDLPCFGPQSRLTLGVEMQDDSVRDFQVAGLARLEIPLGFFGGSRRLTRLERRMLDRIVRDNDIITVARQDSHELGRDSLTGKLLNNVTVVDGSTANIPNVVAGTSGPNNTVIVDGGKGHITNPTNFTSSIVMKNDQVLRGGGFQVIGSQTGAMANFGTRPTIDNSNLTFNTITMANGSTVANLNLTGGANGISSGGADLTGVTVAMNQVSQAKFSGYDFAKLDTTSKVFDNTASGNGRDANGNNIAGGTGNGFQFSGEMDGSVQNNIASTNRSAGFTFGDKVLGTVSGNQSNRNGLDSAGNVESSSAFGYNFSGAVSGTGTVASNTATNNGGSGFRFGSTVDSNAKVTGNSSSRNGQNADGNIGNPNAVGFDFQQAVAGTVSGNSATNNGGTGIRFDNTVDSTAKITGNTSSNNGRKADGTLGNTNAFGYDFVGAVSGTVDSNSATSNAGTGFVFGNTVSGTGVTNNVSSSNGRNTNGSIGNVNALGFDFQQAVTAPVTGNTASNNGGTGFRFGTTLASNFANNTASGNGRNTVGNPDNANADGFQFNGDVLSAATIFHNSAVNNANNGFHFVNTANNMLGKVGDGTTANRNAASSNGNDGFRFEQSIAGTGAVNNNAASNNLNGGFFFNTIGTVASVTNNSATSNGFLGTNNTLANGFSVANNNGTFSNNTATGNMNNGFAQDNGANSNNDPLTNNGTFTNNIAVQNGGSGFRFTNNGAKNFNSNQATLNHVDGFTFRNDGFFNNNTATSNTSAGYNSDPGGTGTATNNQGSGNGSNNTFTQP